MMKMNMAKVTDRAKINAHKDVKALHRIETTLFMAVTSDGLFYRHESACGYVP